MNLGASTLLALAAVFAWPAALAFELTDEGCPMAHCDARQSNQSRTTLPVVAQRVAVDSVPVGGGGVGCASNLRVVACSFRGDPKRQANIVVYDGDGRRLWDDAGLLGWQAWMSAPIVGADDSVIAADQDWIFRVQPATGAMQWKAAKPDPGTPISPVLVGADRGMVLLATKDNLSGGEPAMTVWDAETGLLLGQRAIRDPATGALYITRNTPAVAAARAYVVASRIDDESDGRLVAVDVCEHDGCGGRGTMTIAWWYAFKGPSGVSPLLVGSTVFFDGKPLQRAGALMAVRDRGTSARRLWWREFPASFGVSPAHDPRGGLWVHFTAPDGLSLMRLSEQDGATLQEIVASTVLGVDPGYVVYSAMTSGRSAGGAVVLMFGAQPPGDGQQPTYLAAVDVSSQPGGTLLWRHEVGATKDDNAAGGQFPVVVGSGGARRVVFQGSKRFAYFVGEP